jgi:hypothetical protein
MKTEEEGFAERLADIDISNAENFKTVYANLLNELRKKKLSKLSRVISNERMVEMFAALLSLGPRFRSMHQFTTAHMNSKFIGIHGGVSSPLLLYHSYLTMLTYILAHHRTYPQRVPRSPIDRDADRLPPSRHSGQEAC